MRICCEIRRYLARKKKKGGGGAAIWEHSVAKKKKTQRKRITKQNQTQTRKPFPSLFYFQFNVSLVIFLNSLYFPNIQVSSFSCTYFYARDKQKILLFLLSHFFSAFLLLFSYLLLSVSIIPHIPPLSSPVMHFFFPVLLCRNYFSVPFHKSF